jgi:F420-dependent hydroxymycolic acid dehydrogenase
MRKRIGFVLSSEQFPAEQLLGLSFEASQAGFPISWVSDHFQPWQTNQGHSCFAWSLIGAITQRAPQLTVGTGVTCPTFRYTPAIVAEAFATLGRLNPGKIFLGVGTGEALNEEAAGTGWAPYPERAERLVEALQIIRKLWTGDTISHQGQFWQIDKARLFDLPLQPVPIYVAAGGPKSARIAGEYGDGWVADSGALQDPEAHKAFAEAARAAGKDPAQMEIVTEMMAVAGNEAEARKGAEKWRFLNKAWKPGYLPNPDPDSIQKNAEAEIPIDEVIKEWPIGLDAAKHIEKIEKCFEQGATTVMVHSPQEDQSAFLRWYGENVVPHFAAKGQ